MPESTPTDPEQPNPSTTSSDLTARLAAVEAERDRLQAQLDAQSNQNLDKWLQVVSDEARALGEIHNTLSWRITRPLRVVRKVQVKVAQVGVARASELAVADLKRRYQGRRR
jgi:hypothetical protein